MFNQPHQHVESAESKRRVANLIDASDLICQLNCKRPQPADERELQRFHTKKYIERVKEESQLNGGDGGDYAPFGKGSFEVARLAVGAAIEAVNCVLDGESKNAYVLSRPPGHHAERDIGRGFCLFNNIAIAALHAIAEKKIKRIAIVDYDVHHGNGTQQCFYERNDVLFISIHQDKLYPVDSGEICENGKGEGEDFNINVPLPPGSGIGAYEAVFERIVEPALKAFRPQLMMISSGFDAAALDPLSHMMLNSSTYGKLAKKMVQMCEELNCKGPVAVHEGGYSEVYVPFCGLRVIEAFAGVEDSKVEDLHDEEISLYGYQSLQAHQETVLQEIEQTTLKRLIEKTK